MKTQVGIREDYESKLGTVEDAVQIFIAREQVCLNSVLEQNMIDRLNAELAGARINGTQYVVEVIQRYHALVGLLKAIVRYDKRMNARRWASAQVISNLHYAEVMARGYGWDITWDRFNTRVERVQ